MGWDDGNTIKEILPGPKCSKTEKEGIVCSSPISAAIGIAMDKVSLFQSMESCMENTLVKLICVECFGNKGGVYYCCSCV